jgi:hypothetical protein
MKKFLTFILLALFIISCNDKQPKVIEMNDIDTRFEKAVRMFIRHVKLHFGNVAFIISSHLVSNTCKGMEFVFESQPKQMSALLYCPFDSYCYVDSTLVLVYLGQSQITKVDLELRERVVLDEFKDFLENDWDAALNEAKYGTTYNSSILGIVIKGDSIQEIKSKLPAVMNCLCASGIKE